MDQYDFELAFMASDLPMEAMDAFLKGFLVGNTYCAKRYETIIREAFSISQE